MLSQAAAILFQTQKNRISKYVDYAADYELKFKRIVSKICIYIKCSYRSQTTMIFNSLKRPPLVISILTAFYRRLIINFVYSSVNLCRIEILNWY